jgi:ribosome-associated protein
MAKKQVGIKTEKLVKIIADAILDKKGNDVVSLNVGKLPNSFCKYFVICNAESTTQVGAIAGNVEDKILENFHEKAWKTAGYDNSLWIILDYVDVVVHIFQTQYRSFYKLEDLWADADLKHYSDEVVVVQKKTRTTKTKSKKLLN